MVEQTDFDDLVEQLKVEFRDDVHDRLGALYETLKAVSLGRMSSTDGLLAIRRDSHSLRGAGSSFGFPLVSLIAQRLEAYLTNLKDLTESQIVDLHTFADRIAEAADRDDTPDLAATNSVIRALPSRYEFDIADVEIHDVDIMLVSPNKIVARRVAAELAACGFKVNTLVDPIEALSVAVRVPPDMIIASAVMDGLGGVDLIRALKAISLTETVPMALLTSLDATSLKGVPDDVAMVRLGPGFGDDIASAITRFNLG